MPLVLGFFLVAPVWLAAARVLGAALVLAFVRRQRGVKLVFNLAHLLMEVSVALCVFYAVAGTDVAVPDGRTWVAALAAGVATHLYGWFAITLVISINEGRLHREEMRSTMTAGAAGVVVNTSIALVALAAFAQNPMTIVLLALLLAVSAASYRAYSLLRHGYSRLEMLYGFTGAVGHTVALEQAVSKVLSQARIFLRSAQAGVVWIEEQSGGATSTWLVGETPISRFIPAAELASMWWAPALAGQPVIAAKDPGVPRHGCNDAVGSTGGMAVPLRTDDRIDGVLIVADRLDDVTTFGAEDLKLFSALANHAQVALANGRLLESEHHAFHDALTGLPNRRMLSATLNTALAHTDHHAAVLLMDLDGFKDVNDSLGHAAGDALLVEVGHRLTSAIPEHATLARLGGDEFCIVIPSVVDAAHARAEAQRLLTALRHPYELADLTIDIGASIGISIAADHDDDGPRMLQKADMAMYSAKQRGSSIEMYTPNSDFACVRRLGLIPSLRGAIENRTIEVHYQPKVELITGRAIGAEALARWTDPTLGPVGPDEFIPIAERNGLIRPLTTLVLQTAVDQCAAWREVAPDLTIAVNIAERNLLDPAFPAEIEQALRRANLAPEALVLEISERMVMRDVERIIATVDRLRRIGVTLSLDDFGTGQSSFALLKYLPVSELKIDRSFVTTVATNRVDAGIVRATIELGHQLGMRIVAEGVEDDMAWAELVKQGCDHAQGYRYARPLPAARFDSWLWESQHADEPSRP